MTDQREKHVMILNDLQGRIDYWITEADVSALEFYGILEILKMRMHDNARIKEEEK